MNKEKMLEFDGTVTEVLPDGNFRVKLDNDHEILAYTAGKMRKFRIRTGVGDRVIVEMSPYDLERGRISFRHKSDRPPVIGSGAGPPQYRRYSFGRRLCRRSPQIQHGLAKIASCQQVACDLVDLAPRSLHRDVHLQPSL